MLKVSIDMPSLNLFSNQGNYEYINNFIQIGNLNHAPIVEIFLTYFEQ